MDGKDRFNFRSRVSFRFVPGFSVSRFTTTRFFAVNPTVNETHDDTLASNQLQTRSFNNYCVSENVVIAPLSQWVFCRHNCLPPDIEKEDLLSSETTTAERKIFGVSTSDSD